MIRPLDKLRCPSGNYGFEKMTGRPSVTPAVPSIRLKDHDIRCWDQLVHHSKSAVARM